MEGNGYRSPEKKPDPLHGLESPKIGNLHQLYSSPRVKVSFRILCLASQAGAVIGISRTLIEQLRISTKSSIFVEEAPPGSPDRIITITALPDPTSWVKLGVNNAQEKKQVEVSKAQDALIRVFEVLIEKLGTSKVSCRLLMKASNVGAVKGNCGEIVEGIMKETGCKVEIRTDDLPICASHDDALVEVFLLNGLILNGSFFTV